MINSQLLIFLLVIYIITLYLTLKFDRRIMFISAILWLIPITEFNDMLIITVFIIMFFIHLIIPLSYIGGGKDDF